MNTHMANLGNNLRRLRNAQALSRDYVAKHLNQQPGCNGITANIIGHLEQGRKVNIPLAWLQAFAWLHQITIDDLTREGCPAHPGWHPPRFMTCRVCEHNG